MVIQSLLSIGSLTDASVLGSGAALAVGAVGLTGALAVVGFVRLFGMTFLAQPRTEAARGATETSGLMQVAMAIPAVGCIVFGLLPMAATRLLRPVTEAVTGQRAVTVPRWTGALESNAVSANYVPLLVAVGLALVGVLPWLLARWRGGPATERVSPTWVCGIDLQPRMQYTATAFAKPLRLIFHALIRPERTVVIDRQSSPYVISSIHYEESVKPVYERYLYEPFLKGMLATSHRVRAVQSGSVRLYLTFFLITLVVVIALAQ
jgi:hydrogenase-4 component B